MASNKKPRRRYAKGSGLSAISASLPFAEEAKTLLKSRALAAWVAMKEGQATTDDFDLLAATTNVCLIRAEEIGQEAIELCLDAQKAMIEVRARHDRVGRFGVDAEALAVMPSLLHFYDELLDHSTPKQMACAVEAAFQRLNRQIFYKGA